MLTLLSQVPPVTDAQATTFMQWILHQGPWAVFTVALLFFIYRAGLAIRHGCKYISDTFIVPVKDAAINHLSSVGKTMAEMSGAVDKLGSTLETVSTRLNKVDEKTTMLVEDHKSDRESVHNRIKTLEEKIDSLPKLMRP